MTYETKQKHRIAEFNKACSLYAKKNNYRTSRVINSHSLREMAIREWIANNPGGLVAQSRSL